MHPHWILWREPVYYYESGCHGCWLFNMWKCTTFFRKNFYFYPSLRLWEILSFFRDHEIFGKKHFFLFLFFVLLKNIFLQKSEHQLIKKVSPYDRNLHTLTSNNTHLFFNWKPFLSLITDLYCARKNRAPYIAIRAPPCLQYSHNCAKCKRHTLP